MWQTSLGYAAGQVIRNGVLRPYFAEVSFGELTPGGLQIRADMPGVTLDLVQIEVETKEGELGADDFEVVTIKGTRADQPLTPPYLTRLVFEIPITSKLTTTGIQMVLENGVLEITIPCKT